METHNVIRRFQCQHCDYSANTLGYIKIHYTKNHEGCTYIHNPEVSRPMSSETKVYRCLSCDYLFGNLSDMKRHLKIRHHVQVKTQACVVLYKACFPTHNEVALVKPVPNY